MDIEVRNIAYCVMRGQKNNNKIRRLTGEYEQLESER